MQEVRARAGENVGAGLRSPGDCVILCPENYRESFPGSGRKSTPCLFVGDERKSGAEKGGEPPAPSRLGRRATQGPPYMRTMKRHPVVDRLWDEVDKSVEALGFELVQMIYGGPLGNQSLTAYVDREGGVNAEDCAMLAEHISVLLDALDPIPGSYNLIVSSPGLDRPLGQDADFARFTGRRATIRHQSETGRFRRVRGTLAGVEEGRVLLDTDGGRLTLPLEQISAANLVYEWEEGD